MYYSRFDQEHLSITKRKSAIGAEAKKEMKKCPFLLGNKIRMCENEVKLSLSEPVFGLFPIL